MAEYMLVHCVHVFDGVQFLWLWKVSQYLIT